MNIEPVTKTKIIYANESLIPSFHKALDQVAREKIYIEMVEALEYPKIHEHQKKLIQNNLPTYFAVAREAVAGEAVAGEAVVGEAVVGEAVVGEAVAREAVVGWCDISNSTNPRFSHRGFLGMGLLKEYRRLGLGKALITKALAHAKDFGFEKVELQVYSSNLAARALYNKVGFMETGVIKKYRKVDGRYFDSILMEIFF